MPSQTIKIENPSDIEILAIEITISKNKILAAGIYKPPNLSETDFTTGTETIISKLSNSYEKLILMGDFNMTTSNQILSQFLDTFVLSPLNIRPTCFKNSKNPSCIDLLLKYFKPSFMKTNVFETGISDHHKMISTIMKLHITRESPKTKYYRDYRKFEIDYFSSELSRQYTFPEFICRYHMSHENKAILSKLQTNRYLHMTFDALKSVVLRYSITWISLIYPS